MLEGTAADMVKSADMALGGNALLMW